jgi:TonB family protein
MKTCVPIGMAMLVASLLVPEALGQHAQADLDRMPIFGMPSTRLTERAPAVEWGTFRVPDRAYLGIDGQDIAGGRAGALEPHGVKVTQVEAGSPAAKAGFKVGDIVFDYNGKAVEGKARLSILVNETDASHQVRIGVWRAGTRLTLTATVEAIVHHPDSWPVLISRAEPELTPQARTAGVEGAVSVYAEIGTNGRTYRARVLEGLGYGLDAKAMEAVAQWRFNPGTRNGVPVIVPATLQVYFRLLQ